MTLSFLQAFFLDYGYYAVFGALVLCGMGLPLPEDITLVTAGVISELGDKNVHIMLIVAYFGILCGDWMMYLIGWKFGPRLRQSRWFSKILTPERMIQTETLFHRYGSRVIFVARFLPGLRAPIYVMTGITRRISFWHFTLMDGLAALVSVPVFVYIGFYGAENHEWMLKKMHELSTRPSRCLLLSRASSSITFGAAAAVAPISAPPAPACVPSANSRQQPHY